MDFASFVADQPHVPQAPAEPPLPPSTFADFVKQTTADDTLQRARTTTVVNTGTNAETAAQAAKLAPQVGLPQATVETDVPRFQAQVKTQQNTALLDQNPLLAKWVAANPDGARVAQDEYDKLDALSKVWKQGNDLALELFKGMGAATNQAELAVNRALGVVPAVIDKMANTDFGDWWYRHMVEPQEEAAPAFTPGEGFGAKTAHSIGSLLTMLSQITLTGGQSAETQAATGVGQMVAQAGRQMVFPSLTSAVNTGHDVYAATGDASQASRAAIGAYLTTTLQGAVPLSVPGGLMQRLVTGAVSGAVTGEAQRVAMNALLPEGMQTRFDPQEALFQAIQGAMMGGVLGPRYEPEMYRAIRDTYTQGERAERAEQTAGTIAAASELANGMKLKESAPEAFRQFVQSVSEDGNVKEVWVGARPLADAFAQSGIDPRQIQGLEAQIREGLASGGDVRIPVADYLTHVSGTPADKMLLPELKAEAGGMTYGEAQEHFGKSVESMKALAEKVAGDKQQRMASEQASAAVRDDVLRQLTETKRFPDSVNKAYAELARSFYETQAERLGTTPDKLYADMPLTIVGDEGARPEALIQHRKRVSVLQSIVECLS